MTRPLRSALLCLLTATLLAACGGDPKKPPPDKPDPTGGGGGATVQPTKPADFGVHGMLVFGLNTKFISHLPMYSAPHNYQVIAEIKLLHEPGKFNTGLFDRPHESGYHTFKPEPFDLSEIKNKGKGFRMKGTLYAGHFERDDAIEIGQVVVEIARVVLFRELPTSGGPAPVYPAFVFGDVVTGEFYMAHIIGAQPSFDQITLIAEGGLTGNPKWAQGIEVEATVHPDKPIDRYGNFSLQVRSSPVRVITRAVYTEKNELR